MSTIIRSILWVAILLILAVPVRAENVSKWTTTDYVLQAATLVSLEMDREQTIDMVRRPVVDGDRTYIPNVMNHTELKKRQEINPILGSHPSEDKTNTYFAGVAVAHTVAAHYLPSLFKNMGASDTVAKYSRTVLQVVVIAVEVNQISRNNSFGLKMEF